MNTTTPKHTAGTKDETFSEMFGTPQPLTEREINQLRAGEKFLLGKVVSEDLMTPEEKSAAVNDLKKWQEKNV